MITIRTRKDAKILNVLGTLPKKQHATAKQLLFQIRYLKNREDRR